MRGVEPADSGVAHQRVAATLHLHGGLRRDRLSWIAVGAGARSTTRTWVEWESNPRFDGVRIRCKPAFATDPFVSSSHPLESNQNLAGFSCARRPHAPEWEIDPRACSVRARGSVFIGCLPGHPSSSSLFGCQRSPAVRRAHLGPRCDRRRRERTLRELMIWIQDQVFAKLDCVSFWPGTTTDPKRRRAAWFPWAARSAFDACHVDR